ncbi:hypothetical protein ONE56_06025 [Vibrio mytili]|uniref:hypothetical protein n=1 Tax=Vibrio mytili TaxID=50718 RepID=UPI003C703490
MDVHQVESWLLGTMPGVIVLGAIGSILATIVVKLVIYVCKKGFYSGVKSILNFMYPLIRSGDVAEAFRGEYEPENMDIKYLIFIVMSTAEWLFVAICWALSTLFMIYTFFDVGLDNGLLLSVSLAIFFFCSYQFVRHSFAYTSYVPQHVLNSYRALDDAFPKTYKEYRQKNNKEGEGL